MGGHHGGGGHGGGRRGGGFYPYPVVYDTIDDDDDDIYEVINVNGESDAVAECNMAGEIIVHHKRRKPWALVG